jgi:hypothetical protein
MKPCSSVREGYATASLWQVTRPEFLSSLRVRLLEQLDIQFAHL